MVGESVQALRVLTTESSIITMVGGLVIECVMRVCDRRGDHFSFLAATLRELVRVVGVRCL